MNSEDFLSRREVASWLGVSVSSIDRMVARGEIPVVQLGSDERRGRVIFPKEDLKKWIEGKKKPAK